MNIDPIEQKKLEDIGQMLRQREEAASRSRLALVRISKRKYRVVALVADERGFWNASYVTKNDTKENCERFIAEHLTRLVS